MNIIIGGATGLVGQEIRDVLEELSPEVTNIIPVASERSLGQMVSFRGRKYKVISFSEAMESGASYAIFSAGSEVSKQWAERYAKKGITVIDNSSAWRLKQDVPLIVPEVNAQQINEKHKIIANPNCSTIQMVVALNPLHKRYNIKRLVIATYQSVSGSGVKGIEQLHAERIDRTPAQKAYPHRIDLNALPHGGNFLDNGYTSEEQKLVDETRKILDEPQMRITSTVVRIPVTGGHSEAVNIEFEKPFVLKELRECLGSSKNLIVQDEPRRNEYPMPAFVRKSNLTHIGRIRRDESVDSGVNLWIVADNLRKGAATNAVQILNYLIRDKEVSELK